MLKNISPKKHFYDAHVFVCLNERSSDHPRGSCFARGSSELHSKLKKRAKELGIKNIRINKAGCLERCELGPVIVIYPEGVWYHIETDQDIEEILQKHILNGEVVKSLRLTHNQTKLEQQIQATIEVQVSKVQKLTEKIKAFELRSVNKKNLPTFDAGSHINIIMENGKKRSYSLASNPQDREHYLISVLHESNGRGGSAWMHNEISAGSRLTVEKPKNNFKVIDNANSHLFLAGGIGITPILAMGYHLKNIGTEMKATLHYCTRSACETAFLDEAREIFGPRLHVYHDGGEYSKGINLTKTLKNHKKGQHLYICGPRGLLEAAKMASLHWPQNNVHFELFSSKENSPANGNVNFNVLIKSQGLKLQVPPNKTILEVIREAGMNVDSSCEEGVCGSCKVGIIAGEAVHKDGVLTDHEKSSQSHIMVCVSRAKKNETLILDL